MATTTSDATAAEAEWRVPAASAEGANEGDAAGFSDGRLPGTGDRCIPSRYVEGLRSALDPAAQQQHIARGFREALHMAGDAARRAHDDAEDRLLTALEGLSSTRKRGHMLRNFADVRRMREEAESAVERWSAMCDLVKRLTEELDEHAGLFTEKCCIAMAEVTDEVKRAAWDHPAIDPWAQVPGLTSSLLELARDTPATSISKTSFRVAVAQTWTAEGALQQQHKAAEEAKEAASLAAATAALPVAEPGDSAEQAVLNASITSGTSRPPAGAASPVAGSPKALRPIGAGAGAAAASPRQGPATDSPPVSPLTGTLGAFENAAAAASPSPQERQANIDRVLKRTLPPLKITCMTADESGPATDGDSPPTANGVAASWDLIFIGAADGSVLGITPSRLKEPLGEDIALAAAQGRNRIGSTADKQRRAGGGSGAGRSGPGSPSSGKRGGGLTSSPSGSKMKTGGKSALNTAATASSSSVGGPDDPLNSGPYRSVPGIRVYPGHVYAVTKLLAFTHKDLRMIASASADKTVRVSNVGTRELLFVFAENRAVVLSLAYHRQLHRLVSTCADGSIHLWEPRFGEESTMVTNKQRFGVVSCIAVTSNVVAKAVTATPSQAAGGVSAHRASMAAAVVVPPRLIAGTRTGAVFVLEPITPESTLYQPTDVVCVGAAVAPNGYVSAELGLEEDAICREGHSAAITAVEAPHHPYVFTGDESGVVNLFDISRMARLRRFHGHVDAVSALAVTSDGFLITASHDATIVAWSWRDGAQLHRLAHHFHRINGLLLGVLPKARVDVAALIASSNNAMRSHGASDDRWPGSNAIALRYLPGVAECTMFSAALDGTIGIATAAYDMSS